ncbi:ABC transporter ATP-binding protein [Calidithermus chliarophilus]|uniref:ABC transporter ATP-binding protein n=1 Tax=Calidithermus chliarophilus TaxID=52023 RepID=UPI0003FF45C5|nr:ABC transporter ATP-binding protein [Calidithermus chliarophilus]
MAGIRCTALRKVFASSRGPKVVLEGVNLEVRSGEFVAVLGPSGCGKSTLLNILSGLERDYEGRVSFPGFAGRGEPVLGYVFQEPRLLPWMTVRQNIHFALEATPSPEAGARVRNWLERVGLADYYDYYPNQLSVGMQHRVSLARALILDPQVLLLDEPFSSLDEITAMSMRGEVLELWKEQRGTVLLVTHNPLEAVYLADRVLIMAANPGRIVAELDLTGRLPRPRDPEDRRLWELSRETVRLLSPHLRLGSAAGG